MTADLLGPDNRYSVIIEAMCPGKGQSFVRCRVAKGVPLPEAGPCAYRVTVEDVCTFILAAGENGLTIRSLRITCGGEVLVTAVVTAGACAPEWLCAESVYVLFRGERPSDWSYSERYIPLEGVASEGTWAPEECTPLDRLAIAVGRSIARANAALLRTRCDPAVALVSSVTIRVAVDQTHLARGKVLVCLSGAKPDPAGQFVELTLTSGCGEDGSSGEEADPPVRTRVTELD